MPTLVRDPPPVEFEALLERRRRLGQDLFDEVWEGVRHMNPAPSGRHARIEAQLLAMLHVGLHRDFTDRVFYSSAATVIEIVSPGDETLEKRDFYAAHGVEELLIVDPQEKTVDWMGLEARQYKHVQRSRLIELGLAELAQRLGWPPPAS